MIDSPTVSVKTFGCKVNTYDSGLLEKSLGQEGWQLGGEEAQVFLLNSCAVTEEATREALRQARRIKSKNPQATVVLTGCAAQVDGPLTDHAPGIDLIVANSHKGDLPQILRRFYSGDRETKVFRSNIFRNESLGEGGGQESTHTRSYLKIQDGCNSFCSFCVIPFARGKSRSLTVPMILERVQELRQQGSNEVVLTGVHIGDYLDEETYGGPFQLDDLVEQVLRQTDMPRVRLTSLEPIELTEKLMGLFKNPRLCPHFHMSLQSLSTPVLKGMRRNYTAEDVGRALRWIAKDLPHAFVGLDVITGFPGETDELFNETFENLKNWPWTRIHVFPYSERRGTRAAEYQESVPWPVRKQRAKQLRELSLERQDRRALEQVGLKKQVLVLRNKSSQVRCLSDDYWDIYLPESSELPVGSLQQVQVQGYQRGASGPHNPYLVGELL